MTSASRYIKRLEDALAHIYVLGCPDKTCDHCKLHLKIRAKHPAPHLSPEARRERAMAEMGNFDDPNETSRRRETAAFVPLEDQDNDDD